MSQARHEFTAENMGLLALLRVIVFLTSRLASVLSRQIHRKLIAKRQTMARLLLFQTE